MKIFLLKIFLIFISFKCLAQSEKVKVFLSCRCDDDFIKQNTLVFDYVRDRTLSDIEVFVFIPSEIFPKLVGVNLPLKVNLQDRKPFNSQAPPKINI